MSVETVITFWIVTYIVITLYTYTSMPLLLLALDLQIPLINLHEGQNYDLYVEK